jgi:hypothetical protein
MTLKAWEPCESGRECRARSGPEASAFTFNELIRLDSALGRELATCLEVLAVLARGTGPGDLESWHKRRDELTALVEKVRKLTAAAPRSSL